VGGCCVACPSGGPDFAGTDALAITVSDEGSTGAGGAQTSFLSVPLLVEKVNDAPGVVGPAAPLVVDEDAALPLGISVFDEDVEETPGGEVEVEVWTGHSGRLEVQSIVTSCEHVNQVASILVSVRLPANMPKGYVPVLSGGYKLALDVATLTGDPTAPPVVSIVDANAVAKVRCAARAVWGVSCGLRPAAYGLRAVPRGALHRPPVLNPVDCVVSCLGGLFLCGVFCVVRRTRRCGPWALARTWGRA
jgi:hypothetical protein